MDIASWAGVIMAEEKKFPPISPVARKLAMVWFLFGISCGVPAACVLWSDVVPIIPKVVLGVIGIAYWVVGSIVYYKYAE